MRLQQERHQQQRNNIQNLNHRVNRRSGGILVRVADGITGHGSLVRLRELPEAALPRLEVSDPPDLFRQEAEEETSMILVRHGRFERPTFGSGGRRSIQLS